MRMYRMESMDYDSSNDVDVVLAYYLHEKRQWERNTEI